MKNIYILCFNILLFFSLFILSDYVLAYINYGNTINEYILSQHKYGNEIDKREISKKIPFRYSLKLTSFKEDYNKEKKENFSSLRRVIRPNINKKPSIIIFGCSFAYGQSLADNETLGFQIAQNTQRTVYNRAFRGKGLNSMLWQTKNNEFYDDIKIEPEYAIYLFITDHICRIYNDNYIWPTGFIYYKKVNNNLIEATPFSQQLRRFHITRKLMQNYILYKTVGNESNRDEIFNLVKLYFELSRKELQKRYPNIKFIIIKHPAGNNEKIYNTDLNYFYETLRWKELEDEGFIIYDISKEFNEDFTNKELMRADYHPSAKSWEIFSKKFVKDIKL